MNRIDTTSPIFTDPDKRRAWVGFQLRMQGQTLADLARELSVSRNAPGAALRIPYPKMERAIAEAVGVAVHILFPERYSPDGERLIPMGRPATTGNRKNSVRKIKTNDTTASQGGNVH